MCWLDHFDENELGRYTIVLASNSSISFAGLFIHQYLKAYIDHPTIELFLHSMAWLTA